MLSKCDVGSEKKTKKHRSSRNNDQMYVRTDATARSVLEMKQQPTLRSLPLRHIVDTSLVYGAIGRYQIQTGLPLHD